MTTPPTDLHSGTTGDPGVTGADTEAPGRRFRRPGARTVVAAALIGLCAAGAFSVVALQVLDDSGAVDPETALQDLTVTPAPVADTPVAAVGRPAPDVTLDLLDGGAVRLADLRGTPVLLNFWSSTCAPCVAEMPVFESLSQRAGDRVQVLGVDVIDSAEGAAAQIARTGVTYPNAGDPQGRLLATFGGASLPRTALIAADGTVLELVGGALDADALEDLLDRNGVPVP